jgi:two-component system chemotaxis response regulator CheB
MAAPAHLTQTRHRACRAVLFRSAATCAGSDALGILLTGMGDDGARGMKALYDAGARTIAQDEATCIVFGMPREAISLGAVEEVLPIDRIADAILRFCTAIVDTTADLVWG